MQANHKAIHLMAFGMIWLSLLSFFPENAFSQDESPTPRMLLLGVMVAPPAYMKMEDNRWAGFGVDLWQALAKRINV